MRINISAPPSKSWLAVSLWLVSSICLSAPANAADTVAIRNIYLNQDKQLVVEFDNPTHIAPVAPQVLDYPGDKHDIVLEFTNTSFAVGQVPRAKAVLDELTKTFPGVSSIAYAASNDATKARIRVSVAKDITTHPSLAKINQDAAVINLDLPSTPAATAVVPPATTVVAPIASAPIPTAPIITATAPAPVPTATTIITATASAPVPTATVAAPVASVTTTTVVPATTIPAPTPTLAAQATTSVGSTTTAVSPAKTDVESATTPAATNTEAPHNGFTSKAMHGIKGAWHSSLKASSGQVGKISKLFGSNKQDNQQNSPDEAQTPTVAASPAVSVPNNSAVTDVAASVPAPSVPTVASATTSNTVSPITLTPPESLKTETKSDLDIIATPATTIQPADISTSTEKKTLDLPRITIQPQESTIKDDLITPIKPDEVKPEQKPESVSANISEPAPPATTKTTTGDSSIIADLKTSFDAPLAKESKDSSAEQKDSPATPKVGGVSANNIASIPPTSTTDADSEIKPETNKVFSKVALKAMTAHSGGKDYFPPKTADGQEPGYAEETLKHYNEAVHFHLTGKLPEAITEYRAALIDNPRMEEAHSNLGLIFNQQNKYDQAMVEFHKALAINPKDAITYNGIGAAMRAQKNMLAAVKNWQTAISLDPNLASAHYNLGTAYEMDKDLEKALSEYKLAVKCDDKLGEGYYHMGLILQKMNNRNLALEQFKQAVKVSSEAEYAQDAKHRVTLLSQKKDINM